MLSLVKLNDPEFIADIPDKIEAVVEIPDEQKIIDDKVLSSDQLIDGGMVRTTSWVHSTPSKNALRLRKAKEKAEAGDGGKPASKQINFPAPLDDASRDALKDVGKLMLSGKISAGDLAMVERLDIMLYGTKVDRIYTTGGLRARLLRRLLK